MIRATRSAALLAAVSAVGVLSIAGPASADTLYAADAQNFNAAGTYYAGMNFSTDVTFPNSYTARLNAGTSFGGVKYRGPYGDSAVKATSLKHTWTITLDATVKTTCSLGAPSGFTCTTAASSTNAELSNPDDFGASLPTSTSLPKKTWLVPNNSDSYWNDIQIASAWKVVYPINGTKVSRTVGDDTIHYR